MATSQHQTYSSEQSLLTTELNSLADATTCSVGTAYNNSSNAYLFCDVTLDLATQGSARSAGALVEVYMEISYDSGSTYSDADQGYARPVAVFALDAATTARRVVVMDVPVPRAHVRFLVRNETGQAFASSGNSLFGRFHSIEVI